MNSMSGVEESEGTAETLLGLNSDAVFSQAGMVLSGRLPKNGVAIEA